MSHDQCYNCRAILSRPYTLTLLTLHFFLSKKAISLSRFIFAGKGLNHSLITLVPDSTEINFVKYFHIKNTKCLKVEKKTWWQGLMSFGSAKIGWLIPPKQSIIYIMIKMFLHRGERKKERERKALHYIQASPLDFFMSSCRTMIQIGILIEFPKEWH